LDFSLVTTSLIASARYGIVIFDNPATLTLPLDVK